MSQSGAGGGRCGLQKNILAPNQYSTPFLAPEITVIEQCCRADAVTP